MAEYKASLAADEEEEQEEEQQEEAEEEAPRQPQLSAVRTTTKRTASGRRKEVSESESESDDEDAMESLKQKLAVPKRSGAQPHLLLDECAVTMRLNGLGVGVASWGRAVRMAVLT